MFEMLWNVLHIYMLLGANAVLDTVLWQMLSMSNVN